VVVVGQVARDLAMRIQRMPEQGGCARVTERLEMLGGSGANQAADLVQLGMRVWLVGAVGDDESGLLLLGQAVADGIDATFVDRRTGTATGLIVTAVDDGGWRHFEDVPEAVQVSHADVEAAAPAIRESGTLIVQLRQPAPVALAAAELGREAGCRIVLDGAPADGAYRKRLLAAADVVHAGSYDAELLTGHPIRTGAEAIDAATRLLEHGLTLVALAAGPDGNALAWPGGSLLIPLGSGPVVDVTGASDAFVASLVASLARGRSPAESGRRAAAAAAWAVTRLGGRPQPSGRPGRPQRVSRAGWGEPGRRSIGSPPGLPLRRQATRASPSG
jgi:ribokinase